MGFSNLQDLQWNIDALGILFDIEKEKRIPTGGELMLLMQYSGFGGLKFILNPADSPADIKQWRKSDQPLFAKTRELLHLLRNNSTDEKQFRTFVESIRSSVLTSFFTSSPVINALAEVLKANDIYPSNVLEPSAGSGAFVESFKNIFDSAK